MSSEADIQPAPSSEEAAAIALVLRLLRQVEPVPPEPSPSGWQRAARREALRRNLPHEEGGWRRDR